MTNQGSSDPIEAAAALYRTLTGSAPQGVWSAPGRVNLIGEHTDYNDGYVLPFAIDRRTAAAVGTRGDGIIRVVSAFTDEVVEAPLADLPAMVAEGALRGAWAGYVLGVAWALMLRAGRATTGIDQPGDLLDALPGVDIALASDVPVGAGLSSSAAIECAIAVALDELWGLGLTRPELAAIGRRAENEAVGAPTGILDQSASLLSAADAAVFLDCRSLDSQIVPLGLRDAGLEVVVIDTNVEHAHASGGYRAVRAACEHAAAGMGVPALRDLGVDDLPRMQAVLDDETFRRARHIVTEDERVLETVATLRTEGPLAIGPLLLASHASMRDDFGITVPEHDVAVNAAMACGAIGARMTGGGFGGSVIALVPSTRVAEVRAAALEAFAARSLTAPTVFTVVPSQGARRDVRDEKTPGQPGGRAVRLEGFEPPTV